MKNKVIHIVIHIIHIKKGWISGFDCAIVRIYVLVKTDKVKFEEKKEFYNIDLELYKKQKI